MVSKGRNEQGSYLYLGLGFSTRAEAKEFEASKTRLKKQPQNRGAATLPR